MGQGATERYVARMPRRKLASRLVSVYNFIHHELAEAEKEIRWIGSSYDDLLKFPEDPRREAGFQLGKVQAGLDPTNWKPFDAVGAGTQAG